MKTFFLIAALSLTLIASEQEKVDTTEKIVIIRHGEKPEKGLGQINCNGLNRSLLLPNVLISRYGKPTAIFAANPAVKKVDQNISYFYIRPLATIEPTAVKLGLPVNISYSFEEIDSLVKDITSSSYANSTIFIAWEHHRINDIVKRIGQEYNISLSALPKWEGQDFDTIYVVNIKRQHSKASVDLKLEKQGLDRMVADGRCGY